MGFSDKQKQVLRFPYTGYDALICDGAVRSGKTSVMSLSFILWAMGAFRSMSFAICGKTVGSAERNIIQPLLAMRCWGRLYGGAAGIILVRGQEGILDRPLDLDAVLPGTFAGLYILDRWCGIVPEDGLVTDLSDPDFGLPEYYTVMGTDSMSAARIHHSRILRFTGRELPYLERLAEQYWGASEVESLYREVVQYDNTTANMAALTFRANIDTMEVPNLDQLFSLTSGEAQRRFWNTMQAQSVMRSNFGMQLVNQGSKLTNTQYRRRRISSMK